MQEKDREFMQIALGAAKTAAENGDVPVGAVVVKDGEVISVAYNTREYENNAVGHAELLAISEASEKLCRWRLSDCTLYVTLEPCPMCAGAIINSRIARVVYGAKDAKAGAFGSVLNMNEYPLNHKVELQSGVLECECRAMLTEFFKNKRK